MVGKSKVGTLKTLVLIREDRSLGDRDPIWGHVRDIRPNTMRKLVSCTRPVCRNRRDKYGPIPKIFGRRGSRSPVVLFEPFLTTASLCMAEMNIPKRRMPVEFARSHLQEAGTSRAAVVISQAGAIAIESTRIWDVIARCSDGSAQRCRAMPRGTRLAPAAIHGLFSLGVSAQPDSCFRLTYFFSDSRDESVQALCCLLGRRSQHRSLMLSRRVFADHIRS